MKNAHKKSEGPLESAMSCNNVTGLWETCCVNFDTQRSGYACIVEAHESTRTRSGTTQSRDHESLLAAKGFNSLSHENLAHMPLPTHPPAMNIPDAKASADKVCEKARNVDSMASDESEEPKKFFGGAQKEGRIVHFATLLDLCHLKNSDLEQKFQKYRWRRRSPRWCCGGRFGSCAVSRSEVRQHHT